MIRTKVNTPVEITLPSNYRDPEVLKFSVKRLPQHGTVPKGNISNRVIYTSNTRFKGTDSFTYKVTNNRGVSRIVV